MASSQPLSSSENAWRPTVAPTVASWLFATLGSFTPSLAAPATVVSTLQVVVTTSLETHQAVAIPDVLRHALAPETGDEPGTPDDTH